MLLKTAPVCYPNSNFALKCNPKRSAKHTLPYCLHLFTIRHFSQKTTFKALPNVQTQNQVIAPSPNNIVLRTQLRQSQLQRNCAVFAPSRGHHSLHCSLEPASSDPALPIPLLEVNKMMPPGSASGSRSGSEPGSRRLSVTNPDENVSHITRSLL